MPKLLDLKAVALSAAAEGNHELLQVLLGPDIESLEKEYWELLTRLKDMYETHANSHIEAKINYIQIEVIKDFIESGNNDLEILKNKLIEALQKAEINLIEEYREYLKARNHSEKVNKQNQNCNNDEYENNNSIAMQTYISDEDDDLEQEFKTKIKHSFNLYKVKITSINMLPTILNRLQGRNKVLEEILENYLYQEKVPLNQRAEEIKILIEKRKEEHYFAVERVIQNWRVLGYITDIQDKEKYIHNQLLTANVNLHATDGNKNTLLHLAFKARSLSTASLLLKRGANKTLQNNASQTPLQYASLKANDPFIQLATQGQREPSVFMQKVKEVLENYRKEKLDSKFHQIFNNKERFSDRIMEHRLYTKVLDDIEKAIDDEALANAIEKYSSKNVTSRGMAGKSNLHDRLESLVIKYRRDEQFGIHKTSFQNTTPKEIPESIIILNKYFFGIAKENYSHENELMKALMLEKIINIQKEMDKKIKEECKKIQIESQQIFRQGYEEGFKRGILSQKSEQDDNSHEKNDYYQSANL